MDRETFLLKFGKVGEQGVVCRDRLMDFIQVEELSLSVGPSDVLLDSCITAAANGSFRLTDESAIVASKLIEFMSEVVNVS